MKQIIDEALGIACLCGLCIVAGWFLGTKLIVKDCLYQGYFESDGQYFYCLEENDVPK